ncbi:MAG: uncharacterized protein JWP35_4405 [Caulobacter sp.]|nr:uncharacterized protein [Caulobacter sp.]
MDEPAPHRQTRRTEAPARWRRAPFAWLAMILALCLPAAASLGAEEPAGCPVGLYRLANGEALDVGAASGGALRWRRLDGSTGRLTGSPQGWLSSYGWTGRPDGLRVTFAACPPGALGAPTIAFGKTPGRRIALPTVETTFVSRGARLTGRLVLPPGAGRVPIVVLLQGSEHTSARDFDALQRLLPAMGVGAFVYDKRGTGASQGVYTQDFSLLADDAIAALAQARRLAGPRTGRIGFQGPSQGGWIAPIAATRSNPDFIIVSFGLAISVIDEDREAVVLQMRLKGHSPEEIAKALEVAGAAETLFESGFTTGFEAFDALRAKYRDEPWYKDVQGDFTFALLGMTTDEIRAQAPNFRWNTPFRYDPMATLAAVKVPQLWILGGLDLEAPSGETSRRLKTLIAKGRPITLALYPSAEHGMTEFETAPDGERLSTRYAEGYFRMMGDFARDGRLRGAYGAARIVGPGLTGRRGKR